MGKNIVMRLLAHSQQRKKRSFRRADLIFWLFLIGISITALLSPSVHQAQSQQVAATHQRPTSYASPMQPHDACDAQGNCYPDGSAFTNGQSTSAGKIQDPIGDDAFMFFTRPDLTVGQDGIKQLWAGGVAIVDAFIALLILFNGIRIMVSGSMFRYADVAETIPRVLVALIAAHISLALVSILIGLNNNLCSAFLAEANKLQPNSEHMPGVISFKSIFSDSFKKILSGGSGGGLLSGIGGAFKNLFTGNIGGAISDAIGGLLAGLFGILPYLILELMALTMSAILFGQLIVRILLIDLFTVISAPCIACWALPGRSGQGATSFWLQGMFGSVMSQFLQTVGIVVSMFVFDKIFEVIDGKLPGFMGKDSLMAGVNLSQLIVYIAFLWFIIRMPTLFRLNPSTQMIMSGGAAVGSAVSGAVGGVASAAATGVSLVMLVK
jgi:hypothetical protein